MNYEIYNLKRLKKKYIKKNIFYLINNKLYLKTI